MNKLQEQIDLLTKRIDQHSLDNIEMRQYVKDLEGQIDYQIKHVASLHARIEELEQIIEEELS